MRAEKFELFGGCLGNGVTVCNKAVEENGDYKKVCHISAKGEIRWYVDRSYCPPEAIERIEKWAKEEKEKYDRWFASIGAERRYAIHLDEMGISEFLRHSQKSKEAKRKVEEIKRRQNEYVSSNGGFGGLFEADDTYNDFNREMIAAFAEARFESFIGKVNRDEYCESVYEAYTGQKIFNFACDFIVPFDDKVLAQMIRDWNTPGKNSASLVEQIPARVERLGGINFLWL